MESKNKTHYLTKNDYEKFDYNDTRYYGLFLTGSGSKKRVRVDIKRFLSTVYQKLNEQQLKVINHRQTHYFYPVKREHSDYCCNVFEDRLQEIKSFWHSHFKPLVRYAWQQIKVPEQALPGDCDLLMCGILEPDEAGIWANHKNLMNEIRYKRECVFVVESLYAQFIHHLASGVESACISVFTKEKCIGDHFDRNVLYGTTVNSGQSVRELPSFGAYDKLYALWNFTKHNSDSTYRKLKEVYPEILLLDTEYRQGQPAPSVIRFSDGMIESLMDGVSSFFKEYCQLVFKEDYEAAQWNYDGYFLDIVHDSIEDITNPLGVPDFL